MRDWAVDFGCGSMVRPGFGADARGAALAASLDAAEPGCRGCECRFKAFATAFAGAVR